jgi:Flp pilus assembly pilin Flp
MAMRIINRVTRLWRGDTGQDLIEYALLVALIAMVATVGVSAVGTTVMTVFWTTISQAIP